MTGTTQVLMGNDERMRLRLAAYRARRAYPGPVGELLSRELLSWEEFGYRLGSQGMIMTLVDAILDEEPTRIDVA